MAGVLSAQAFEFVYKYIPTSSELFLFKFELHWQIDLAMHFLMVFGPFGIHKMSF